MKSQATIVYQNRRTLQKHELKCYCDEIKDAKLLATIFRPKWHKIISVSVSSAINIEPSVNFCEMCGGEYKPLNKEGFCSSCWMVWRS